jgi:hypothetical protein
LSLPLDYPFLIVPAFGLSILDIQRQGQSIIDNPKAGTIKNG